MGALLFSQSRNARWDSGACRPRDMAFGCVLRWTLLPLLSYSAFAFDDNLNMESQWLQRGLETVNLRSAAMVDMNNNFTLLFGGISYSQIPGNSTYVFAYNQYPGFNTRYSWRISSMEVYNSIRNSKDEKTEDACGTRQCFPPFASC